MKSLKERVKHLEGIVLEGRPHEPGLEEWIRACEAAAGGDVGPLERFLKQGGVVPDIETIEKLFGAGKGARRCDPREHVEVKYLVRNANADKISALPIGVCHSSI